MDPYNLQPKRFRKPDRADVIPLGRYSGKLLARLEGIK
jgi:hypothetical protein